MKIHTLLRHALTVLLLISLQAQSQTVPTGISGEWLFDSQGEDGDFLGHSVAVQGAWAAVGKPSIDNARAGRVFIYRLESGQWVLKQVLSEGDNDGLSSNRFGFSLAFSPDATLLAIGAPNETTAQGGSVYIFRRDVLEWNLDEEIEANIGPSQSNIQFGFDVAFIDSTNIVVGAPFTNFGEQSNQGAVGFYEQVSVAGSTSWRFNSLKFEEGSPSPSTNRNYGWSVASDSGVVYVGIPGYGTNPTTSSDIGAVEVLAKFSLFPTFQYRNKILPRDLSGTGALQVGPGDEFGISVSADEGRLLVGTLGNTDQKNAFLLENPSGDLTENWVISNIFQSESPADITFGREVELAGNYAFIGNILQNRVSLFYFDGTNWQIPTNADVALIDVADTTFPSESERNEDDEAIVFGQALVNRDSSFPAGDMPGDDFGWAIAADGDMVFIGAPTSEGTSKASGNSNNDNYDSGIAYAFKIADATPPPSPVTAVEITEPGEITFELIRSERSSAKSLYIGSVTPDRNIGLRGSCRITDDVLTANATAKAVVLDGGESRNGCRTTFSDLPAVTSIELSLCVNELVSYSGVGLAPLDERMITDQNGNTVTISTAVLISNTPLPFSENDVIRIRGFRESQNNGLWTIGTLTATGLIAEKTGKVKSETSDIQIQSTLDQCDAVFSTNPVLNADGESHAIITNEFPQDDALLAPIRNRVFRVRWEVDGDDDYDDLIAMVRIGDSSTTPVIELDRDEDGLWDDWEMIGIDINGDGQIDPPGQPKRGEDDTAVSGDPLRKDLYLELDWMGQCTDGDALGCKPYDRYSDLALWGDFSSHGHRPRPETINNLIDIFNRAPVANPDGSTGIDLHVDVSNETTHYSIVNFGCDSAGQSFPGNDSVDFYKDIKPVNFPGEPGSQTKLAHRFSHRYGFIAHGIGEKVDTDDEDQDGDTSELVFTSVGGCGEVNGDDFVTTAEFPFTDGEQQILDETIIIMHEFGHNLGLGHGGSDSVNDKPNHLSVMNYSFRSGLIDANSSQRFADFSRWDLADLNESALDETDGIGNLSGAPVYNGVSGYGTYYHCNGVKKTINNAASALQGFPIDWNCDGDQSDTSVQVDINNDGLINIPDPNSTPMTPLPNTPLAGSNDWENIVYNFQASGSFANIRNEIIYPEDERDNFDFILPIADAGSVPDGNPQTPSGPPYEVYNCSLGGMVNLDASGSSDELGEIVGYAWDMDGDGTTDATGVSAIYNCNRFVGSTTASLTVTDEIDQMAGDDAEIEVALDLGADQQLECGTDIELGGGLPQTQSLQYKWSGPGGLMVSQPDLSLATGAGTDFAVGDFPFTLTVTDEVGASITDTIKMSIIDSTEPVFACNADGLIPPDAPTLAFTATASDQCAGILTPVITNYTCEGGTKKGKRVARECDVSIAGDTITVNDTGGVDNVISWTVSTADGNGNQATETCSIKVANPKKRNRGR